MQLSDIYSTGEYKIVILRDSGPGGLSQNCINDIFDCIINFANIPHVLRAVSRSGRPQLASLQFESRQQLPEVELCVCRNHVVGVIHAGDVQQPDLVGELEPGGRRHVGIRLDAFESRLERLGNFQYVLLAALVRVDLDVVVVGGFRFEVGGFGRDGRFGGYGSGVDGGTCGTGGQDRFDGFHWRFGGNHWFFVPGTLVALVARVGRLDGRHLILLVFNRQLWTQLHVGRAFQIVLRLPQFFQTAYTA